MRALRSILLVLDRLADAQFLVDQAAILAKTFTAELTVVEVVDRGGNVWFRAPAREELQRRSFQEHRGGLLQTALFARRIGVEANVEVLAGSPSREIIREVTRKNHDLVIVSGEMKPGLKEWIFGSTALHLMRKCPCTLWVMKRPRGWRGERILAAINPNHQSRDDERRGLDARILEMAALLAHSKQAELHVVHAWTMDGETLLKGPGSGLSRAKVGEMVRNHRDTRRRALLAFLRNCPAAPIDYRFHFIKGEARSVIPMLARKLQSEVIVMGTLGRGGLPGLVVGNTAEEVLPNADCSVVTVKPEGYLPGRKSAFFQSP